MDFSQFLQLAFLPLIEAFFVSFLTCLIIILTERWHSSLSHDYDTVSRRKVHTEAVPRIGGLAVAFGVLLAVLSVYKAYPNNLPIILLCSSPAFLIGIQEDLTKNILPLSRLVVTIISGGLAWYFLDIHLNLAQIEFVRYLGYWPISFVLFSMAIAVVCHGYNLIDGFHGISAVYGLTTFFSLALIAYQLQDLELFLIASIPGFSLLGFLAWNWPWGRIFLGDGGSYLVGFLAVVTALILCDKYPQVSPLLPILLSIHPIIEVLLTMYRRIFKLQKSFTSPDRMHLHHLIYYRVIKKKYSGGVFSPNSAVMLVCLPVWILAFCMASFVYESDLLIGCLIFGYVFIYVYSYKRLIIF